MTAGDGATMTAHWVIRGIATVAGVEGIPERPEHEGPVQPPGRFRGLGAGSSDMAEPAPGPITVWMSRSSRWPISLPFGAA